MVCVKIKGGLGNQMFEYAAGKCMALELNQELVLDISGITNIEHNVFSLEKLNIKDYSVVSDYKSVGKSVSRVFDSISYRLGKKGLDKSFRFEKELQWLVNLFGVYSVSNGYLGFKKSISKNRYLNGYFQSSKYFDKYRSVLLDELKVRCNPSMSNASLIKKISSTNSVCVHIRRGDYVRIGAIVCDEEYYNKGMSYIKNIVNDAVFYIFSDDIKWVKENIKFNYDVCYIEENNPNYEELRLMYSCKHFVISNSSFSWWGQYLSDYKEKIVVAPSRWFVDDKQKCDIYMDNFKVID